MSGPNSLMTSMDVIPIDTPPSQRGKNPVHDGENVTTVTFVVNSQPSTIKKIMHAVETLKLSDDSWWRGLTLHHCSHFDSVATKSSISFTLKGKHEETSTPETKKQSAMTPDTKDSSY